MDAYREFWNMLIFGSDGIGSESFERYWITMALVALIFFAVGVASIRVRFFAPAATAVLVGAYVVALAPFMVWAASCGGCGASYSYDAARSGEAVYLHWLWGGVFTMGAATLWLGVLLGRGVMSVIDWLDPHSGGTTQAN